MWTAAAISLPAPTFNTLYNFPNPGFDLGDFLGGPLFQAANGNLYGTAAQGDYSGGSIFKITPAGVFTPLYSFDGGAHGAYPYGGLVQAADGDLYGITLSTQFFQGTILKLTTADTLTTPYTFPGSVGAPTGPLTQAQDGVRPAGFLSVAGGATLRPFRSIGKEPA